MTATPRHSGPRISVIVPHRNTPDLLGRCLSSITSQSLDAGSFEVIVVDNGSTTPLEAIRTAFPRVRFLSEPAPGPGMARNTGIAAATAPLIACIDADCIANPGWLQAACDALAETPEQPIGGEIEIAVVDPRNFTGIEAYECVFGFRQRLYIERKHFSVTANLALSRSLHARIGPFGGIDIAEDLDWGRRAHAMGHATRFVPAMRVKHPARPDLDALKRKWRRHVGHDWHSLPNRTTSHIKWHFKILALVLTIPLEAAKVLASPRIPTLASRFAGIAVLAHIRTFRAREMRRIAGAPPGTPADVWNSTP